jgi:hypothetical protein
MPFLSDIEKEKKKCGDAGQNNRTYKERMSGKQKN